MENSYFDTHCEWAPVLSRKLNDMNTSADADETICSSVALLLFQTENLVIFTFYKDCPYVDTAHDFVSFVSFFTWCFCHSVCTCISEQIGPQRATQKFKSSLCSVTSSLTNVIYKIL